MIRVLRLDFPPDVAVRQRVRIKSPLRVTTYRSSLSRELPLSYPEAAVARKKGDATFFPIQRGHSVGSTQRSRLQMPCRVHALVKHPQDLQVIAAVAENDQIRALGAAV